MPLVLINVESGRVNEAAEQLCRIAGVNEVFSVAGRYDLVALVRVHDNDSLAEIVSERIRKVPGITLSETLIAFRVYDRSQLEAGFHLGADS